MLVTERQAVLDVYAEAAAHGWVIPCFCSENLTCTEAVLAAVQAHGRKLGREDLPVTLALTVLYPSRPQATFYTQTRRWDIGVRLFLSDLQVLTAPGAPYEKLRVLAHLDHVQHDLDAELLAWDLKPFSSIMFDASKLPFEENIRRTRQCVEQRGADILIEGACDEIVDAAGQAVSHLTTPEAARRFLDGTGADLIVANLGTEHRASAAELHYHGELARRIKERIGARMVLHGCSSVPPQAVAGLFQDGIVKVNIWATLERDSSPALLADMLANAAKIAGPARAAEWRQAGILGPGADLTSRPQLSHYTTTYRQQVVHGAMKAIVAGYLKLWYR